MDYRELYKTTVEEVTNLIGTYKMLIDTTEPVKLEQVKAQLTADKLIMRQLFYDGRALYLEAKDDFEEQKAEAYKKHRTNGLNTLDATNEAKFDTIGQSRIMHDLKCKTDKAKSMIDDITDVTINISIALREMGKDIKYG